MWLGDKMNICIYRGTNEIGGNCIEISTKSTRILFDIGTPLASMQDDTPRAMDKYLQWLRGYGTPVRGVYADDAAAAPVDAIFISHCHGDHYGLLPLINTNIPVYTSPTLKRILLDIEPLKSDCFNVSHLDIREIGPNMSITIGDLTITARPVDHAPGAYAFEITDGVRRVVYTGDIRFHSNQSWKSWNLSSIAHAPDYLIMEGTRMSRPVSDDAYPTEMAVRDGFKQVLGTSGKLAFISLSAQNLDRLCSLISACRSARRKLVIRPYTAALLDMFHDAFPKTVPAVDEIRGLRIFYGNGRGGINGRMNVANILDRHRGKEITIAKIMENPSQYVVEHIPALTNSLLKRGVTDYDFIYSMWHGYLTRQTTWDMYKNHLIEIHASGHATVSDLKAFVTKMAPRTIIPIHTECKNNYESEFGVPALVLNDNEITAL